MEPSLAPRNSIQYPITMELQYTLRERTRRVGMGLTKRISSREVVFTADQPIAEGTKLEIAIVWPVLLHDRIPLKLVIEGEVFQCGGQEMTVRFVKYQFRTRRPPAAAESVKTVAAAHRIGSAMHGGLQVMCAGR